MLGTSFSGKGTVPFADIFRKLADMRYGGPYTLEMWNDDAPNSSQLVIAARSWILEQMNVGGLVRSGSGGG